MKRNRPSPAREIVARNIRLLRAKRGLSQEELAHAAQIHRTNISKIERGLHAVSVDNLYWIAKVLGVPVSELVAVDTSAG